MRNLCILASLMFLASCQEETIPDSSYCHTMTFSDALPVQFWPVGCDTYNETVPKGVHEKCFCAPWQCDDEINIQFTDDEPGAGTEVVTLPALNTWSTRSVDAALVDWTEGSAPTVTLPGAGVGAIKESEILYVDYDFIPDRQYSITVNYTNDYNIAVSNPRNLILSAYDDSFNALFSVNDVMPGDPGGSESATLTFIATSLCTKIGIVCISGSNIDVTIDSHSATISTGTQYELVIINSEGEDILSIDFEATELPAHGYLHSATFSPSDLSPDICDQQIRLEIRDQTSVRAYSDCLNIATVQDETELIEYSNNRNVFGLVYLDVSPEPVFSIRVPCRFFHEVFPEEDEAIELTSSVITTSGQLKSQKRLEVQHVPYYFHKKLQLILKHQTLTINGKSYQKEEKYEINSGNPKWPIKSATCLLTEKNSVLRNVV